MESLEELKEAHDLFLNKVQRRILFKTSLKNIDESLNNVTNLIIEFNGIVDLPKEKLKYIFMRKNHSFLQ